LQLLPVLDDWGGPTLAARTLAAAGVCEVPDGQSMIPETDAARLHQQLRRDAPEVAPKLATRAGVGTGKYILANRIPKQAQWVLKALPKGTAARMLSRAIAGHAWTFVGSGQLAVVDPWTFEIVDNPLIAGETSKACLCHWHVGVFQQLYQALVSRDAVCVEKGCGAQEGQDRCRFELQG
jgi:divinyl protochlorophyllide a 8-vinyl-reductase